MKKSKLPSPVTSVNLDWAEFAYKLAVDAGKFDLAKEIAVDIAEYHALNKGLRLDRLDKLMSNKPDNR